MSETDASTGLIFAWIIGMATLIPIAVAALAVHVALDSTTNALVVLGSVFGFTVLPVIVGVGVVAIKGDSDD